MGYVKFTEQVGEISKTYEFGSYEDFKDWENKVSEDLLSSDENLVDIGKVVYQVGDKVKMLYPAGDFKAGEIGVVRSLNSDGTVDTVWTADKEDFWWVEEGDFVRYEE